MAVAGPTWTVAIFNVVSTNRVGASVLLVPQVASRHVASRLRDAMDAVRKDTCHVNRGNCLKLYKHGPSNS